VTKCRYSITIRWLSFQYLSNSETYRTAILHTKHGFHFYLQLVL
jgi:hypothetical protein